MNDTDKIIRAGRENKLITIRYQKKDGTTSIKTLEPYSIKSGKLYAYCVHSQGIRSFFINKIYSVEILDRGFAPRWPIEL